MRLRSGLAIAVLGGLFAATGVSALGQEPEDEPDQGESETAIKRSELPPAVEKTVAAESAHATVKGFTREVEHGQTFYEAELVVGGHARDVLMDEAGTI